MIHEVNEDNGRTYDNAVSAMGKYLIYQANNDANSLNMSKQFIKLLPLKYDLEDYFRVLMFLLTGMTLFLIISTLFPNIQYLRPAVMPRDNFCCRMVANIYRADTPTNLWPSIHVYNSIGVAIAVRHSKRIRPLVKRLSDVLCVLIILSTMFIKQHTIFDVLTAFILAIVMYVVAYRSELVNKMLTRHELRLEKARI